MYCPWFKPLVFSSKSYLSLQSPQLLGSSFLSSSTINHSSPSTTCSSHSDPSDPWPNQAFSLLKPFAWAVPSAWIALCLLTHHFLGESPPGWVPITYYPNAPHPDDSCALSESSRKVELGLPSSPIYPPGPRTQVLTDWTLLPLRNLGNSPGEDHWLGSWVVGL